MLACRTFAVCLLLLLAGQLRAAQADEDTLPYPVVDTGQVRCYDARREIAYPAPGKAFFGQDAHYAGHAPRYKDLGDGTVLDLVTRLMWQKTPGPKGTYAQTTAGARRCRAGGHTDWRLPTIKELYSLILFSGLDVDPMSATTGGAEPFLDDDVFDFAYGDPKEGERLIDSQWATSTKYVHTTMGGMETVFGVNFADGRIKGYGLRSPRGEKTFFARYVRGNPKYGRNDFVDNEDGTVTDRATGLVWMKRDSGHLKAGPRKDGGMTWEEALAFAEGLEHAGHADWRLPNAKELHSLVDYTRSPATTRSAAIDALFDVSTVRAADGSKDFPWYWSSTTHASVRGGSAGVYVCFGRSTGWMRDRRGGGDHRLLDVHGAGSQRSDPKAGDPKQYPRGRGPQGDVVRIYNLVRCVRGGVAKPRRSGPAPRPAPADGGAREESPPRGGGEGRRTGWVERLDRDGDGKVSRAEFDGPPRAFGRHDANGDGFLTEDEAPQRGSGEGRPGRRDRPRRGDRPGREPRQSEGAKTLEVMTVGTGSPIYSEKRSSPSMLVTYGDTRILVDMGEGTVARLQQAQVNVKAIDAFLFTHHHRDHNADAMSLLPLAWQRGFDGPVVGPTGTGDLVEFLRSFFAEDLAYRMKASGRTVPGARVIELPRERAITVGEVRITSTEVPHSITTFAYRFEAGGRSVVISGDLGYAETFGSFAKNADVLVMDSGGIVYEGEPRRPQRESGNRSKKPRAHPSLLDVAKMAAAAKAKKLVLVHIRADTVDEAETRKRMAPIYEGEIVFAEDLQTHR